MDNSTAASSLSYYLQDKISTIRDTLSDGSIACSVQPPTFTCECFFSSLSNQNQLPRVSNSHTYCSGLSCYPPACHSQHHKWQSPCSYCSKTSEICCHKTAAEKARTWSKSSKTLQTCVKSALHIQSVRTCSSWSASRPQSSLLVIVQSADLPGGRTETAVLRVLYDILCSADGGDLLLLVLLDISAAFDDAAETSRWIRCYRPSSSVVSVLPCRQITACYSEPLFLWDHTVKLWCPSRSQGPYYSVCTLHPLER